jgi:hypothetical protein
MDHLSDPTFRFPGRLTYKYEYCQILGIVSNRLDLPTSDVLQRTAAMSDTSRADRLKFFVGLDQVRLIRTTIDARTQSVLKHTGDALVLELSGSTQRLSQPYADPTESPADIRSWDLEPLGHYTEFVDLTIVRVGEDGVEGEVISARRCLVPSPMLDVLDFEGADEVIKNARDTDGIGESTQLNVSIRFSQMDTEARLLLAELSSDKRWSPPIDPEGVMVLEATHAESEEHPVQRLRRTSQRSGS